jgi:hypothetical protein
LGRSQKGRPVNVISQFQIKKGEYIMKSIRPNHASTVLQKRRVIEEVVEQIRGLLKKCSPYDGLLRDIVIKESEEEENEHQHQGGFFSSLLLLNLTYSRTKDILKITKDGLVEETNSHTNYRYNYFENLSYDLVSGFFPPRRIDGEKKVPGTLLRVVKSKTW